MEPTIKFRDGHEETAYQAIEVLAPKLRCWCWNKCGSRGAEALRQCWEQYEATSDAPPTKANGMKSGCHSGRMVCQKHPTSDRKSSCRSGGTVDVTPNASMTCQKHPTNNNWIEFGEWTFCVVCVLDLLIRSSAFYRFPMMVQSIKDSPRGEVTSSSLPQKPAP